MQTPLVTRLPHRSASLGAADQYVGELFGSLILDWRG